MSCLKVACKTSVGTDEHCHWPGLCRVNCVYLQADSKDSDLIVNMLLCWFCDGAAVRSAWEQMSTAIGLVL